MPRKDVEAFEDEMRAGGVDWQLVVYGGAIYSSADKTLADATALGLAALAVELAPDACLKKDTSAAAHARNKKGRPGQTTRPTLVDRPACAGQPAAANWRLSRPSCSNWSHVAHRPVEVRFGVGSILRTRHLPLDAQPRLLCPECLVPRY